MNSGDKSKVELLLKQNVQFINYRMRDENGNSLVAIATCKGDLTMLKFLIKSRFDINIPNHDGNTPLHFGISLKQLKCVE